MKMSKVRIVWEEKVIEHIRKHGIRKSEVENSLNGKTYTKAISRNDEKRTAVLAESEGRVLFLVLRRVRENIFIVLSAYEAPEKMKKLYKRKAKK
jgi:uncharacterized DUF497 family protein